MKTAAITLVLIISLIGTASAYEHQTEPSRFFPQNCDGQSFNMHWNHEPIDVYINVDTINSVEILRDSSTTYWTRTAFAEQVKMAIAEFNISAGAYIRLRYAGTTTSLSPAGIIILANPNNGSAIAFAGPTEVSCVFGDRGRITKARVVANAKDNLGAERIFQAWGYTVPNTIDVWGLFTHELGHAVGLGHSDEATLLNSAGQQYAPDHRIVMNSTWASNIRHFTKYDKDTLRILYGPNTGTIRTLQSGPSRGFGNSWRVLPDSAPPANVTSGVGKMTETAQTTLYGWADPYAATLKGFSRTNSGLYSTFSGSSSLPISMPPAMTYSPAPLLSKGKTVYTSTVECCGLVGANAVDGNTNTRWSSAFSDPQWITIDLGASYQISKVKLNWEAAYGRQYYIGVSNNNSIFTTVVYESNGNGGIDEHNVNVTGRYVRMFGLARGTGWGYSLWEFEVYGVPEYRSYWLEKDPDMVLDIPPNPPAITPYGTGFVDKKIRWMSSPDGVNWTQQGYLTDPSSGQAITTWTDSVSAGYDPYRKVFAVLWIDNQFNGLIYTMPAQGSSQTSNVYSPLYVEYWEPPSLACLNPDVGGISGCMIVGMQRVPQAPLFVMSGEISTSGTWSNTVSQQYLTFPQTQAPSVWASWSGDFILGVLERSDNSFAMYRRSLWGSTWTFSAGYGFSGYYISPPVLGGAYSSGWSHAVAATVYYGP
jgi:hypothetical protein